MTLLESGGGFTALSQRLAKKIASIALAWTFENGPMGRRWTIEFYSMTRMSRRISS